ncbi:MAG: hypothetical protein JSU70_07895 [Phycisphaerales bacterium]|nr:MAG: hypothetical protein JSU70_07895 [Phycisphaerales bacterium]
MAKPDDRSAASHGACERLRVIYCLTLWLLITRGLAVQLKAEAVLDVSSFFGGATDGETMRDICVDDDGYVHAAITTGSWDLPITDSSWEPTYNDNQTDWPRGDIFIGKLDPAAKSIIWST